MTLDQHFARLVRVALVVFAVRFLLTGFEYLGLRWWSSSQGVSYRDRVRRAGSTVFGGRRSQSLWRRCYLNQ